jgi:hypothetical protein
MISLMRSINFVSLQSTLLKTKYIVTKGIPESIVASTNPILDENAIVNPRNKLVAEGITPADIN